MPLTTTDSIQSPFAVPACRIDDAPGHLGIKGFFSSGRVPFTEGYEPGVKASLPGYDSGVLCLLLLMFLMLAYNFRHYSTFLKNFATDLFSIRRREGFFDVRTASETGVQLSMIFMACLSEGIIINSVAGQSLDRGFGVFAVIGVITLVAALYYVWQLGAYFTVGAVFIDRVSARMWMKGFNASQALLAMLLVVPALVVLFNPGAAKTVALTGAGFYILTRIVFICKGFRLFYDNFGSLVYFILYLCSLEIVPLILLYRTVLFLQNLLTENLTLQP